MIHSLNNIIWDCLSGPHRKFTVGSDEVRRYVRGFSPIVGFADSEHPNFSDLAKICEPGEHVYGEGWLGAVPKGWEIHFEGVMIKMAWEGGLPVSDDVRDAILLGPEHLGQTLALTAVTLPGPFGKRTFELGEYFGIFESDRLLAMAGERFHAGNLREISAVCTHPEYQGRGLARHLITKLIRREMERGELPVLHVMRNNTLAYGLYERMGFKDCSDTVLRVISRT